MMESCGKGSQLTAAARAAARDHLGSVVDFTGRVELGDSAAVTLTVFLDFGALPTMIRYSKRAGLASSATTAPSLPQSEAVVLTAATEPLQRGVAQGSTPPATDAASATASIRDGRGAAAVDTAAPTLTWPADLCAAAGVCGGHHGDSSSSGDGSGGGPPACPLPRRVFVGVRHETSRHLVSTMALTKRAYLGPTSLNAELALVMTNVACVRPGCLVLEPFVGTGSIAVAIEKQGGLSIGTDIDFRVLVLGKVGRTIASNYAQYGLGTPELIRGDNSLPALRRSSIFDAIVTDPPYGVRAGARKTGTAKHRELSPQEDYAEAHIASTQVYAEGAVISDLLVTAARMLRVGGRLVYLLPACAVDFSPAALPRHPCLELVSFHEQPLTMMLSRFVVIMRKHVEWGSGSGGAEAVAAPSTLGETAAVGCGAAAAAKAGPADTARGGDATLKGRIRTANIEWYNARIGGLEAMRKAPVKGAAAGVVASGGVGGSAGAPPLSSSSLPAGAAAAAPLSPGGEGGHLAASASAGEPQADGGVELSGQGVATGGSGAVSGAVSGDGISRSQQKFIRKRLQAMQRQARAHEPPAPTADGAAPAPPAVVHERKGAQRNKVYRDAIASGAIKLPIAQAPFDKFRGQPLGVYGSRAAAAAAAKAALAPAEHAST